MPPIRSRIGAVLSWDEWQVRLLGYGVYEGLAPSPVGPFGMPLESHEEIDGVEPPKDHRLVMDDGRVVWGEQCIWASESRIRELIGDREVILVELSPD